MKSFIKIDDAFFMSTRKPLKLISNNIEFRCSYLLTNMSLDQFTKRYCKRYTKLVGNLDYNITRYPDTKLSEKELSYCINDVLALNEALYYLMQSEGDNLATIPLTSTGYVRRDIQKAIKENKKQMVGHTEPLTPEVFSILRKAFRGGNTHANRFHVGELLHNVSSADRASSYPSEMVNKPFPVNFKKFDGSFKRILSLIEFGKAVVFTFKYCNLQLKQNVRCPYIASTKVFSQLNSLVENGRILLSDEGIISVTDIDIKIILDQYEFDVVEVLECYEAEYKYLPKCITDVIRYYYNGKTSLKGIPEEEEFYMKSKNRINSIYGMTVYNPFKSDYEYDDIYKIVHKEDNKGDLSTILRKQALKHNLNYAVGVWVTAYARFELQKLIDMVGDDFVYCDTDSVKYLNNHDNELNTYNSKHIQAYKAEQTLQATDRFGKNHIGGVFEDEGVYKEFKTLGSKKYCYCYDDDIVHLTCAGAPKSCAKELSCVDDFDVGIEFKDAGLTTLYNEIVHPKTIIYDNHEFIHASNIALIPRQYAVSLEPDLEEVLKFLSTSYNDVKDGFSQLNSKGVFEL